MNFGVVTYNPNGLPTHQTGEREKFTAKTAAFSIAGQPVRVTGLELYYFKILADRAGTAVSKADILELVYSRKKSPFYERTPPEPKIVDVVICKLRGKLAHAAEAAGADAANPINTIWGTGYSLNKPAKKAA